MEIKSPPLADLSAGAATVLLSEFAKLCKFRARFAIIDKILLGPLSVRRILSLAPISRLTTSFVPLQISNPGYATDNNCYQNFSIRVQYF